MNKKYPCWVHQSAISTLFLIWYVLHRAFELWRYTYNLSPKTTEINTEKEMQVIQVVRFFAKHFFVLSNIWCCDSIKSSKFTIQMVFVSFLSMYKTWYKKYIVYIIYVCVTLHSSIYRGQIHSNLTKGNELCSIYV